VFGDFPTENGKGGDEVGATQVCCADCRPSDCRCDSATVVEQEACLVWFELPVGKACEMEHSPKAVRPIGEVESSRSRSHTRIDPNEDDVQGIRNNIGQAN